MAEYLSATELGKQVGVGPKVMNYYLSTKGLITKDPNYPDQNWIATELGQQHCQLRCGESVSQQNSKYVHDYAVYTWDSDYINTFDDFSPEFADQMKTAYTNRNNTVAPSVSTVPQEIEETSPIPVAIGGGITAIGSKVVAIVAAHPVATALAITAAIGLAGWVIYRHVTADEE